MAPFGGEFTPNFLFKLERLERAGQVDTIALMVAMVGAARAAVPLGRRMAEAVLRRMSANIDIDLEDIFAQVDCQQPQQLQQQQAETCASSADTDRRPPSIRRVLGFEDLARSPIAQPQPPQQQ